MTGPFKGLVTNIVLKKIDNFENDSRHDGTDGNRNDPGDEHTAGDAPMDGADAFSRTDTHDGTRYDMSRTDRQMKEGCRKDDKSAAKPLIDSILNIFVPMVEMIRQPPAEVPNAMDVAQAILTQIGISMVSI